MEFKLHAPFKPMGDQPEAIEKLAQGVKMGLDEQVLLGVTGSGKTFTMASVIEKVQRPTLVLAHNKTLAAQLCAEFKEFFPENAVEYFVSYYDYYQPEAYIPHTDTYIAKDASTNEEIDRLRLSATCALLERRDVIVVSSVSCIYGLGEPEDFEKLMISLRPGMTMERDFLLKRLIEIRYERNDVAFERNRFRVRGDTVELYPAYYRDKAVRVEFFGDEIDRISEFNPVNGQVTRTLQHIAIYPASHYVTTKDKLERAIVEIDKELDEREAQFLAEGKAVEAQRIRQRTRYDIEMLRELGYCTGIENYSRVISGRPVGSPPLTLIDYFPKDFLLFVDESHVTLPQVRAMYNGDRARKESLVEYGFRLPCAFDNRPLKFDEFEQRVHQRIYVSATPGDYEKDRAGQIVEQVIRPTGLLDPKVEVRPVENQIDDLVGEINARAACATCTRTSRPSSAWSSSAACASASSTCSSASTSCARALTSPRSRWSRFWTRIKKASSAAKQASSRPSAAPRETPTASSCSTPTPSPPRCAAPWTRLSAAAKFRTTTTRRTASSRRPSERTCARSSKFPKRTRNPPAAAASASSPSASGTKRSESSKSRCRRRAVCSNSSTPPSCATASSSCERKAKHNGKE